MIDNHHSAVFLDSRPTDETLLVHPSFIGEAGGEIQREEGSLRSDLLDDRDCSAEPEKRVYRRACEGVRKFPEAFRRLHFRDCASVWKTERAEAELRRLQTTVRTIQDKDTSAKVKGQSLADIPPPDGTLDDDYARITKHFLSLFSTSIDELGRRAAESGRAALGDEQSVEIDDEELMDEDTSPQGDVQVGGKFIQTLPGMPQYNIETEPTEWLWRLHGDALFSLVYLEPDLPVSKDLEGTDIVRAEAGREVSNILSKQSVSEVEEIMNAKGCYPFPVRLSESSDVSLQKSGVGKTFGSRKRGDRSSSSGPLKKS
ncbi:hypothetical protein ACEPAI_3540 [Sanghuangporus weigelae]